MKRERGNIYAYAGIAIAVLGLISGLFFGWQHSVSKADERGYQRGVDEMTAKFEGRDNKQLQAAIAKINELEAQKSELERKMQGAVQSAEVRHVKELTDVAAQRDGVIGRLRQQLATARASAAAGSGNAGAAAAADPGKCDGLDWRRVIPDGDRTSLVDLAARGNKIIAKLNLCRATLAADRGMPWPP